MFSKEEFIEWRSNPITKELYQSIQKDISDTKDLLGTSAGENPLSDRFAVGGIAALESVLEWKPELEKEENDD